LELVRIVVSIISTTPNVVLSILYVIILTLNILLFWHRLSRLMHWCLRSFVFESPWAWRLCAETCSSSYKLCTVFNLLCAFIGIYDWLIANCGPFVIQDNGQRQLQIHPCHPVFSFHFMGPNFHPLTKQQDLLEFCVALFIKRVKVS